MRALPEYVPFPLYHGTSTIWKASIETFGLGSRNVIQELRAIEFCSVAVDRLHSLLGDIVRSDPHWMIWRRMADQGITPTRMNFRHGEAYLTPSRYSAWAYASENRLGSELLSECSRMYDRLSTIDASAGAELALGFADLVRTFSLKGQPLLVRVDRVRVSDLMTETGEDPSEQLTWLLDELDEAEKERSRLDALRRSAAEGYPEARMESWSAGAPPLTAPQILNVFGQQLNFATTVTIPASDLVLEQPAASAATS